MDVVKHTIIECNEYVFSGIILSMTLDSWSTDLIETAYVNRQMF